MAQYKGAASEAGRAMQLMKKREKEREQLEQLKQKIAEVTTFSLSLFSTSSITSLQGTWQLRANVASCLWWNVNNRCNVQSLSIRSLWGQWRHHRKHTTVTTVEINNTVTLKLHYSPLSFTLPRGELCCVLYPLLSLLFSLRITWSSPTLIRNSQLTMMLWRQSSSPAQWVSIFTVAHESVWGKTTSHYLVITQCDPGNWAALTAITPTFLCSIFYKVLNNSAKKLYTQIKHNAQCIAVGFRSGLWLGH